MLNLITKDFKLLFSAHGGVKKRILSVIATILMAGFVVGVEWFLFSTILEKIQNFNNATKPFMTLFLFIISCLMILLNMVRANQLFFNAKDIEQLVRRPVSNAQIVTSKLLFLFVTHYFITLLLVYPILIAYGNLMGKSLIFYYLGIFYPVLSFLFEGGLALILVYPFKLLSDFLKKHTVIQFCLSLVLMVGACILYNYVLGIFMELVINNNINAIFTHQSIQSLISLRDYLVPINFLTDLFAGSGGFAVLPFLGIAGGIFILGTSIVIFAFNYLRSIAMQAKPGQVKDALNLTSPTVALFKKELFLLFKDSNNTFSFTGLLIVQPFLVYIIVDSMNSVFSSGAFAYYMSALPELIPLIDMLIVMLFTLIINQGATTYIQSEKSNVRLMKILPISPIKQLFIKAVVPFALSVLSLLVTLVILGASGEMAWLTVIVSFLLTLILLAIFDVVSLKEEMRIGNNRPRSTLLSTCYSYLLPVAFVGTSLVGCIFGADIRISYLIGFAVFILLGLPCLINLKSKLEALFLDLEMVN